MIYDESVITAPLMGETGQAEWQQKWRKSAWKALHAYFHVQLFFVVSYYLSEQRSAVRDHLGWLPPEQITAVAGLAASCSLTVATNTALSLYDKTCKLTEMKTELQGSLEMFGPFVATMTVLSYYPLVDEMVMLWLGLLSVFLVMLVKYSVVEGCRDPIPDQQVHYDLSNRDAELAPEKCDTIIKQGKEVASLFFPMVGAVTVIGLLGGGPEVVAIVTPVVAASGVGFCHYFYSKEDNEDEGNLDSSGGCCSRLFSRERASTYVLYAQGVTDDGDDGLLETHSEDFT